jgi:dTMP kinase
MMATPLFLSLDGIDGTGKSTQCRLLADWLRARGLSVTQCTDPGGTAIGGVLRELVLRHRGDMTTACEAFLFMASRAQLVAEVIRPALDSGNVVVSDRFVLANVVYQGYAGGLDVEQLWQMGRLATGGLVPDLTLVLDLPLDVAMSRRGREPDRMENKARSFHEKVRSGFLAEARRQPDRIRIVDATPSVEIVHEHICKEVEHVLAACPRT